jgi:NAD(P)-dependent dehydrogenase (short-subunit alcohol dehydrogenase family)
MSGARELDGRRVVITGAARGIGALLSRRLHERGGRVALLGLEPEQLAATATACGGAPWFECDVADRSQVDAAVAAAVERLGGLDVAVANAGIGAQMTLVDGDAEIWDRTLAVNLAGTYNLVRAAGRHVAHPGGYFLLTASLAAAVHPPLMSAYCASKAAVEALGNSLRIELRPSGARVGVAYYAELDTEMTTRGFDTEAASRTPLGGHGRLGVAPVGPAIDALERGIARRSRRIVSPRWVGAVLPVRMLAQRLVELQVRRGLRKTLEIARRERPPLTTPQPGEPGTAAAERDTASSALGREGR